MGVFTYFHMSISEVSVVLLFNLLPVGEQDVIRTLNVLGLRYATLGGREKTRQELTWRGWLPKSSGKAKCTSSTKMEACRSHVIPEDLSALDISRSENIDSYPEIFANPLPHSPVHTLNSPEITAGLSQWPLPLVDMSA